MTTLDDVYRKFGETAEAAQLLETELGNIALWEEGARNQLLEGKDPDKAEDLLLKINKQTLGTLLRNLGKSTNDLDPLAEQLELALAARNRLMHGFYERHNFRRNSSEGCDLMLADLEELHGEILGAYVSLLKLHGFDPETADIPAPTEHLNLR